MTVIVIGITLILMWFVSLLIILFYIRKIKNDLLYKFSDKNKENAPAKQPFGFINHVHPKQLLSLIQQEHPQVIALVLSYTEPDKLSIILQGFPHEVQADIIHRIAGINYVDSDVCREIERTLEKKLSAQSNQEYPVACGIEKAAKILNSIDELSRISILKRMGDEDHELAEEIGKYLKN